MQSLRYSSGAAVLGACLALTPPALAQSLNPYSESVAGWQIACGPFEFAEMNQLGQGCGIERADPESGTALRIALRAWFEAYVPRMHLVIPGEAITASQPEIALTVDDGDTAMVGGDVYAMLGDEPLTVIFVGVTERYIADLREAGSLGVTYTVGQDTPAAAIFELDGLADAWAAAAESQGWPVEPEP
jgi:hypothetical protein